MNAFLNAFAAETGLSDHEADEQWVAYSRQLSDAERRQIERGGTRAGERMGRQFRRDHPETDNPV